MKNLNKTILSLLAIGVATLGVSCQKINTTNSSQNQTKDGVTVLTASSPSSANTKLNINHVNEGDNISITWQNNSGIKDRVSIFDADTKEWVANFTYNDTDQAQSGDFVITEGSSLSDGNYIAVYPAIDQSVITNLDLRDAMPIPDGYYTRMMSFFPQTQPREQLSNQIFMRANFSVTSGTSETMVFYHENAFILIKYSVAVSEMVPSIIEFKDGDRYYKVDYENNISNTSAIHLNYYKGVRPNSGTRELIFDIIDNQPQYTYNFSVTTDKIYEAGHLYIADINSLVAAQ